MSWTTEETKRVEAIEGALTRAGFPVKTGKPKPRPAAPAAAPEPIPGAGGDGEEE